ncbi:MAG: OpgC family protein [Xanthobacteraceae bacterium]
MSIAGRVAAPEPALAADGVARRPAPGTVLTPATALSSERELRIDLFRGLALWLIYIDHVSPDLLSWFTIRSYGFSDAAEIFIFISGYTAALVYGRAMRESGFLIGTARVLRRVWQIYIAQVFLFTVLLAEITFLAASVGNRAYLEEMGILGFIKRPDIAFVQAMMLRFRPLNMDVLPLYIVLMLSLPLVLRLMSWRANLTLALSVLLYFLTWKYDLYLAAYPDGYWAFNPFAWQMLFVFGVWCALGGAWRLSRVVASPVTLWLAVGYVLAAFFVTLTWYFPQLAPLIPSRLAQWMYPIDKTDLDVLRFAHFLALAAITVRFVPAGWPGLQSPLLQPLIVCGRHSLEIFCLGVFLAFAGYFVLIETNAGIGLHILVGILGILIMSAVAYMASWYKQSSRTWGARNGDIAGGG